MNRSRWRLALPAEGRADYVADLKRIGGDLRVIRLGYGFSQQDVAEWCGVTQAQVSDMEGGVASPLGLEAKVAAVFGHMVTVDLADLRTEAEQAVFVEAVLRRSRQEGQS